MTMDMQNVIKLQGISEEEKLSILQVLKRNDTLMERESRRLEQLAVRVQMERMMDERTIEDEKEIAKKSGLWHRILQSGSRPIHLQDGASILRSTITNDLLKKAATGSGIATSSSVETSHEEASDETETDDASVTAWVAKQTAFSNEYVETEPRIADKQRDREISTRFSFAIGGEVDQRKI